MAEEQGLSAENRRLVERADMLPLLGGKHSGISLRELNTLLNAARSEGLQPPVKVGDGWQDIASAPKDGTPFDAWIPDAFGGRRMCGLSFGWRGALRQHGTLTKAELPRWPSHWRPLPAPPTDRQPSGGEA